MILFLGSQAAGYFVSEVAAECKETVTYTGRLPNLEQAANIALESQYDFIVISVDELPGSHEEMADMLSRVQKVTKSILIVLAMNYFSQSELVQNIRKMGISYVINSTSLSEVKRQLEQILTLELESVPPPISMESVSVPEPHRDFQTIAIAGANPRMGTTTQALQMVKYLLFCGKKACYIQMNNSAYISDLKQGYEVQREDDSLGLVTYQNVDLFEKQEKIVHVRKLDYDFYVYDYGVCTAPSFQRVSFLEKDRKFLVCGTSPEELQKTNNALSEFYDTDLQYIFNLVPDSEQKDILAMMEEKSPQTYFAAYTPDPFVYSSVSNGMYREIFGDDFAVEQEVRKKKKSRWGRGR